MKEFKIRASASGKIMTGTIGLTEKQKEERDGLLDRRNKAIEGVAKPLTPTQEKRLDALDEIANNPVLPQTAKSYCDDWIKEQLYHRRKEFTSKYTDKGLINEDESLDFIGEYYKLGLLFKNEEFLQDEFMQGTHDAINPEVVIDAKNSWDCFTFPLLKEKIDPDYHSQGQVYMHLTGRKKFKLVYTLTDTPIDLIEKEAYWYCVNNGYPTPVPDDIMAEFTAKMTYGDIDESLKIRAYDVEYDPEFIKELKYRVHLCRVYIAERLKELGL